MLYGAEAAGEGLDGRHAATLSKGTPGVLHGSISYLLQDDAGQVTLPHSISAGLDYPGVGPEHAYLNDLGRVRYEAVTDDEALAGVELLAEPEGIIPALETAHAVALLAAHGARARAAQACPSSTSRAAATRTCAPSPSALTRCDRHAPHDAHSSTRR